MTQTPYMIGIDIGGTHFRIGAVNSRGDVLSHKIVSSRSFLTLKRPVESLVEAISGFIRETGGTPSGVCLGFPGTVNRDKSTVISCPNLPTFDGVNIRAAVENALNLPTRVEHEVILLLSNDLKQYGLYDQDCVMAVYLGTGIGNAMYIHGRFLEGKNGTSGELGHIPVPGKQRPCPCGNVGCIELIASGKRLEEIRAEQTPYAQGFEAMFENDANSSLIAEYLDNAACAVATEINILDPDTVILGGGVLTIRNFPYDTLLKRIRAHTRKPYPERTLSFIRLSGDPLQGVRGAGIYGWSRLQDASTVQAVNELPM